MTYNYWILAEAEPTTTPVTMEDAGSDTQSNTSTDGSQTVDGDAGTPAAKEFSPMSLILPILLFVGMYFILFRGPRKQQKQQQQMRSSISKNDRIRTIGGIYGTILNIDDEEVVIKIDESNNTKMRISKGAIAEVLSK